FSTFTASSGIKIFRTASLKKPSVADNFFVPFSVPFINASFNPPMISSFVSDDADFDESPLITFPIEVFEESVLAVFFSKSLNCAVAKTENDKKEQVMIKFFFIKYIWINSKHFVQSAGSPIL